MFTSVLLSLAECRDYSLSSDRLEWGLNGTAALGGKRALWCVTSLCCILELPTNDSGLSACTECFCRLTLLQLCWLQIVYQTSHYCLCTDLFLSHKQPSQVGSLFTFLARQMAKRENRLQVNKILFEQVSVCKIRRNTIAVNHARMGNLFKTKFGDFALLIYKFFFVAV